MADGTRVGTDIIADDEITDGGVADGQKVQRVKVGVGTDGGYSDVEETNPLPSYLIVDGGPASTENPYPVVEHRSTDQDVAVVVVGTEETILLETNGHRHQAIINNMNDKTLFIKYGTGMTERVYSIPVWPKTFYVLETPGVSTREIVGRFAEGSGDIQVTELF